MDRIELEAVLTAHPYLRVERPPTLWDTRVDLEAFIRLLGEMISAALTRNGHDLAGVTLNVANVTVEPDCPATIPSGDFVAVTIRCKGIWPPEATWRPDLPADTSFVNGSLTEAMAAARVAYAYSRTLPGGEGSMTAFIPRRS